MKIQSLFILMIILIGAVYVPTPFVKAAPATTTSASGMGYNFQRHTFNASTLCWIFYSDGTDMLYITSDFTTQSATTTVVAGVTSGNLFSVWHDGTNVHYARTSAAGNLYYRRGSTASNGVITWAEAEFEIPLLFTEAVAPSICVDSLGYPWVGFSNFVDVSGVGADDGTGAFIVRGEYNNGTWGYAMPYMLEFDAGDQTYGVCPTPMDNSQVVVFYARTGSPVKSHMFDASAGIKCYPTGTIEYDELYKIGVDYYVLPINRYSELSLYINHAILSCSYDIYFSDGTSMSGNLVYEEPVSPSAYRFDILELIKEENALLNITTPQTIIDIEFNGTDPATWDLDLSGTYYLDGIVPSTVGIGFVISNGGMETDTVWSSGVGSNKFSLGRTNSEHYEGSWSINMYSIGMLSQDLNVPTDMISELYFYSKGAGSAADKVYITYSNGNYTETSWIHTVGWGKVDLYGNLTAGRTITKIAIGSANDQPVYIDTVVMVTNFTPTTYAIRSSVSDGNYLFLASSKTPITVIKYTLDGFYYQGAWTGGTAADSNGLACDNDFIFVTEVGSNCVIHKINKSDMTFNATFTADVGLNLSGAEDIVVDSGNLYLAAFNEVTFFGSILQIDIATFTYVANYTSSAIAAPDEIISDGTYLYFSLNDGSFGAVYKIQISDLSYVDGYTSTTDTWTPYLTEFGDYVYVSGYDVLEVNKIAKSNMELVSTYPQLPNSDYVQDMVNDGTNLYILYDNTTSSSLVVKVDMDNMYQVGSTLYSEYGSGGDGYIILEDFMLISTYESNTYNTNSSYTELFPLNNFNTIDNTAEAVEAFYSISTTNKENNAFFSYSTSSKVDWLLYYKYGCRAEIIVSGGYIYLPTYDGVLRCLDETTQVEIWSYDTTNALYSGVALDGGFVYFGDGDGYFYCLNALTGAFEWIYDASWSIKNTPVINGGSVCFANTNQDFYILNKVTGALIFNEPWMGGFSYYTSPLNYGLNVITASNAGGVQSYVASTGVLTWTVDHDVNDIYGTMVISGDDIFYATIGADSRIWSIDADTGALNWSYVLGSWGTYGVCVSGNYVYSGCADNKLYCVNKDTGVLSWTYTAGDDTNRPVVSGSSVFFGCDDNKVYSLDLSGSLLWTLPVDADPTFITAFSGIVYVGTEGDFVYGVSDVADSDIVVVEYDTINDAISSETTIYASTTSGSVNNVISVNSDNDIMLFWNNDPTAGSVYMTGYRNATSAWDTTIWEMETDLTMKTDSDLMAFYESFSPTGVGWMTSNVAPYTIVVNPVLTGLEPTVINGYLDDPDVGLGFINNVYSMYRYYTFIAIVNTPTNPCDADTIYLTAQLGAVIYFKVRADNLQGVPTYSIISNSTIIDISSVDCTYNVAGTLGEVSFSIRTEWDFPDTSALDVYVEGVNSFGSSGIILTQANNFDVVSSLVASISTGTIYVFLGQQVNIDGNVYYQFDPGNTTLFVGMYSPPDAQFTKVEVWNSTLQATDWTIGNGTVPPTGAYETIFMPDLTTGNQTYSIVLNLLPDYVDGPPANNPTITIYVTADWVPNLDLITGPLQAVFDLFGMTGAVTALWAMLTSIGVYFVQSVTMIVSYVVGLGVMFFNFSVFFFDWVLRMSNFIRDVVAIMLAILGGTSATLTNGTTWVVGGWTGLGSVWTLLGGANLIMFMPFAIFIMWLQSLDSREKTMGVNFITIAINDFQTVYGLINVLTSFAMFIYSLASDWVRWIFGYLSGFFVTLMS